MAPAGGTIRVGRSSPDHTWVRIPVDRDHRFRLIAIIQSVSIPISHSGGSRSSIPVISIIPGMTALVGCR
jgi:hypothetical protein